MADLGPIEIVRRSGDEPFHDKGHPLGLDLLGFWQWSASDIVSNATRGVLAEYLVATALGVAGSVREEWAAYDLRSLEGVTVEVKSAAYIQSWHQDRLSTISFRCPKTLAWDKETNRQSDQPMRQAMVYVFALLAHTDQSTLDPFDVSQWQFFVVPTVALDRRTRSQHSITLRSLRALVGEPVGYYDLQRAIADAAVVQARSAEEPAETGQ